MVQNNYCFITLILCIKNAQRNGLSPEIPVSGTSARSIHMSGDWNYLEDCEQIRSGRAQTLGLVGPVDWNSQMFPLPLLSSWAQSWKGGISHCGVWAQNGSLLRKGLSEKDVLGEPDGTCMDFSGITWEAMHRQFHWTWQSKWAWTHSCSRGRDKDPPSPMWLWKNS